MSRTAREMVNPPPHLHTTTSAITESPSTTNKLSILERFAPEVRNIIYFHCLVSPTGFVEPVGRNEAKYHKLPRWNSFSAPHFWLIPTTPSDPILVKNGGPSHACYRYSEEQTLARIATSLLRVNKRIHAEASAIFWNNNTFHFARPHLMLKFNKEAGWIPFGKIVKLNVMVDRQEICGRMTTVKKMFELLGKNTRAGSRSHCSLKTFEMSMAMLTIQQVMSHRTPSTRARLGPIMYETEKKSYQTWLSGVREGNQLGTGLERSIILLRDVAMKMDENNMDDRNWLADTADGKILADVMEDLQVAWGAKIL